MDQMDFFANQVRYYIIDMIMHLGFGHIGGALSAVDCLAVLYAPKEGVMKINPQNPTWDERDYCVLSKGHAGPALYATLAVRGFFDTKILHSLNQPHTILPSHVDRLKTPGVDMTAGSLGQGIGASVGIALGARLNNKQQKVFCIVGNGELNEGQCWEAIQVAAHQKLNNLVVYVDENGKQLDGASNEICEPFDFVEKFHAFGWHALQLDGHDKNAIKQATLASFSQDKPTALILKTIKGKGVPFLEKIDDHHLRIDNEQKKSALQESLNSYANKIGL